MGKLNSKVQNKGAVKPAPVNPKAVKKTPAKKEG
jgi:hypothetical protein